MERIRFPGQLREWDSLADYAQELAEDCGMLSGHRGSPDSDITHSWPFTCIDWERAGRELEMGGDIWTTDAGAPSYGVYVFRAT